VRVKVRAAVRGGRRRARGAEECIDEMTATGFCSVFSSPVARRASRTPSVACAVVLTGVYRHVRGGHVCV